MSEEVLKILLSIVAAVISGGIGIATIYLKKKWTAAEYDALLTQIDKAVRAAEIMGASLGWDASAKKAWVLDKVSGYTTIPADQLQMLIEAAVASLKAAKEELTKKSSGEVVVKP